MNVRHCCQMAQLVAEEMRLGQGWNSPSYTIFNFCGSVLLPKNQGSSFSISKGKSDGIYIFDEDFANLV